MATYEMKYPLGIQDFEDLRRNNCAYVDKTRHIYELVKTSKFNFLSRPRRFGKSLLLSTIEAYFLAKRELFKGLAMEKLETEWTEYPVLYMDFNCGRFESEGELEAVLHNALSCWERKYGVEATNTTPALRFKNILEQVAEKTRQQVVILVDEYDKPLLQALNNEALNDAYRTTLKAFYGNLKSQGKFIKFAMITGVTRFSKVSIFSDLNNLNDISISEPFAGICGITESELHANFRTTIEEMAEKHCISYEEMSARLKERYDGYRFSIEKKEGIYNPFSLMNTFYYKTTRDYWFETGTPTFLIEQLQGKDYDLRNLQNETLTETTLKNTDSLFNNPISLLFQSGYLTIKDYDDRFEEYALGFPNKEVELSFLQCLLPKYVQKKNENSLNFISNFVRDVEKGKVEDFLKRMQTFFYGNDYRIAGDKEIYFQNAMFLIFRLMGFFTQVGRAANDGRVDITVETADYVYVIEVKLDGTAKDALEQIEEKGYANPYATDKRKIFEVGINFCSEKRCITDWMVA